MTTDLFGLDAAEITSLVHAISDARTGDRLRDTTARAAWTTISEPADVIAGAVIATLGAAAALDLLVSRATTSDWLTALHKVPTDSIGKHIDPDDLTGAVERWTPRTKSAQTLTALRQAARYGARILTPADDTLWPEGLANLGPEAPHALWVRGNMTAIQALSKSIAVVGARAATGLGERDTMEAAAGLVERGYAICGGLSYGIEGMGARATLAAGGITIAFLAGGVDRMYPAGHDTLGQKCIERGAVVSELPLGSAPTRWRFIARNRLIAASTQAVATIEAGYRSGSLNTAAHAKSMGRPVGAYPGPAGSASHAGCFRLIREEGATLVTSADEIAALVEVR